MLRTAHYNYLHASPFEISDLRVSTASPCFTCTYNHIVILKTITYLVGERAPQTFNHIIENYNRIGHVYL